MTDEKGQPEVMSLSKEPITTFYAGLGLVTWAAMINAEKSMGETPGDIFYPTSPEEELAKQSILTLCQGLAVIMTRFSPEAAEEQLEHIAKATLQFRNYMEEHKNDIVMSGVDEEGASEVLTWGDIIYSITCICSNCANRRLDIFKRLVPHLGSILKAKNCLKALLAGLEEVMGEEPKGKPH